uniref:Uncharacterized protein n=1 Tax=Arundo donax TaxID=35708 RepID=A0A0A8ZWV1_ARUDO
MQCEHVILIVRETFQKRIEGVWCNYL